MVLEIKLENFFSIDKEVILDLRAATLNNQKAKNLSNNLFKFNELEVLKSAAIYGANASGKSNLIKAIRFCHAMVYESHKHNENVEFAFQPFKLSNLKSKPSKFFIRFVANEVEYAYSFSLTRTEIITEELYYYPLGKKAKVFTRDETIKGDKSEKYSFGRSVIKRPMDVAENTSRKTLFISRASQMDRELPKDIFNFFYRDVILHYHNFTIGNIERLVKENKPQLLNAMQLADSDIVDFKMEKLSAKGKRVNIHFDTQKVDFEDEVDSDHFKLRFFHKQNPKIAFGFEEESSGTQKLFLMMLSILEIVRIDKCLIVDEIESSLHPKIVEYIIDLFHQSKKAQVIFSTHNTHLLDTNRFRKDQIWFVDKRVNGGTDLYSLYDYSDFREEMNLEKAYLQGRFDAIPLVSSNFEDVNEEIVE